MNGELNLLRELLERQEDQQKKQAEQLAEMGKQNVRLEMSANIISEKVKTLPCRAHADRLESMEKSIAKIKGRMMWVMGVVGSAGTVLWFFRDSILKALGV